MKLIKTHPHSYAIVDTKHDQSVEATEVARKAEEENERKAAEAKEKKKAAEAEEKKRMEAEAAKAEVIHGSILFWG